MPTQSYQIGYSLPVCVTKSSQSSVTFGVEYKFRAAVCVVLSPIQSSAIDSSVSCSGFRPGTDWNTRRRRVMFEQGLLTGVPLDSLMGSMEGSHENTLS